jgi:AraC family transcriptional regulator
MEAQVQVTAGASRIRAHEFSLGRVAVSRFPPDLDLARHNHPQATVAVILSGGFDGRYRSGRHDCGARSVIVEPAGECHANRFGHVETTILTLSLEPERLDRVVEAIAQRVSFRRDAFAGLMARRAADELDRPDDVTPMALEAAALEIVAHVTRAANDESRPAWLAEARSVIHDRFSEALTLEEVAAAVGVEPDRLARAFRRTVGEPLAGYVRRVRVDAAAARLAGTDVPISQVAAEVGFADQSHLTRWFGRYLGTTPGRYRAEMSSSKRSFVVRVGREMPADHEETLR